MYKILIIFAVLPFIYTPPVDALVINSAGVVVTEDFSGFGGAGLSSEPSTGQLDSDDWRISGLSDGSGRFGGTYITGDFARGTSASGVSGGGVWGFDVDNGPAINRALGVQPIGSDFTPGEITLRLMNDTASTVTSLLVAYDVYVFNDASRASLFNFSYSLNDSTYIDVTSADLISVEGAATNPEWEQNSRSFTLSGLNLLDASQFYLRWSGDDVSGSGSRDQFALDNVSITGYSVVAASVPEPETWVLMTIGIVMLNLRRLRH